MRIYSCQSDPNLRYLQQWAGSCLSDLQWVSDFSELQTISDSTIVLEVIEANFQFDVTKKLAESNNHLVLCSFFDSGNLMAAEDLLRDLPGFDNFSMLSSSSYSRAQSVNLNEWLHLQTNFTNQLRANDAFVQAFSIQNKPYKFNFKNTRARIARRKTWHALAELDLLSQALCSWSHSCLEAEDFDASIEPNIELQILPNKYHSAFCSGIDEKDHRKRYQMPWSQYRTHCTEAHLVPDLYRDSYFTLHVESDVRDPCVTYPIYNCLLAGHPFVVLGSAGYYDYLHSLGFKTFDPFIDEDFAKETDLDKRISLITLEIQRLCNLDLDQFVQQIKEICEFNRSHLLNNQWNFWYKTHLELDRFFRNLR